MAFRRPTDGCFFSGQLRESLRRKGRGERCGDYGNLWKAVLEREILRFLRNAGYTYRNEHILIFVFGSKKRSGDWYEIYDKWQ